MINRICDYVERNYLKASLLAIAVLVATLCVTVANAGPPNPTGTFTATPNSGPGPLTFTLAWNTTGATSCTGTGAWNGAKAVAGSQVITGLTATANYILTCTAASGWADLSWTPPTQNTDGSPLTDLASYKVYQATTAAGVPTATPLVLPAPDNAHTITGLAPGTWYFAMKATNVPGIDSDITPTVNKVVTFPTWSANVTVTVTTKPNPPSGLVVTQTMVYEVKENPNGVMLGRNVGTVPLGTACGSTVLVQNWNTLYYSVPNSAVVFSKPPKSAVVVAVCG